MMDSLAPEVEPTAIASSEIDAILSLLDDPDPVVQASIRARLFQIPDVAAPALRRISQEPSDAELRAHAGGVLHELGIRSFRPAMRDLLAAETDAGEIDLERGAFAVALLGYPELRSDDYSRQLDTMAAVLESRLRGCDNGYLAVREINYYLFDQLGFQGCRLDQANAHDPDNSYLNRVMERRTGLPIALSVIYLLVGRRLHLPVFGVAFPGRYLVKYKSATEEFYIDPFNSGAIVNYAECRRLLREFNAEFRPEYLEPVGNRVTIARMLRNLGTIYRERAPIMAGAIDESIRDLIGEPESGDAEGSEE